MTKRHAWCVLLILTAINFLNYVDRQIIITLGPFIRHDLQLTYTRFGWLITAFVLIHSLTSLPSACSPTVGCAVRSSPLGCGAGAPPPSCAGSPPTSAIY